MVTRRFPVVFATAGEHQVAARLQADAVAADDVRYAVVDVSGRGAGADHRRRPAGQDAFFLIVGPGARRQGQERPEPARRVAPVSARSCAG